MPDFLVSKKRVSIPMEVIVPQIMIFGMEENPKEACGIVVPRLSNPLDTWVHKLKNRAPNPIGQYMIDPLTIAQIVEDPELWDDVLVWHTHPSGNVGPSQGDMRTRVEGVKYLVVSLPNGEAVHY